jgi:hypothetical protein
MRQAQASMNVGTLEETVPTAEDQGGYFSHINHYRELPLHLEHNNDFSSRPKGQILFQDFILKRNL